MLRSVVLSVFEILGADEVVRLLQNRQGDAEFMPGDLNKALLGWADKAGGQELRKDLNLILAEHRKAFKEANSVWSRVTRSMHEDDAADDDVEVAPEHLRCVEYLTFAELGDLVLSLLERVFPGAGARAHILERLRERWRENLSRVRRLRNRAAHLRNVDFQDAEDLTGMIDIMRRDLIEYGGWR